MSPAARSTAARRLRPAAVPLRAAERGQGPGHRAVRRPGRPGRLLDRHAVRPARRRGPGRHGVVGDRAGLPDVAGLARPTGGPRPAGSAAGSASRSTPTARWRPAWAPRSSWPRPPSSCACARPDRDTVLYPSVSYPTYAMGATLAGRPGRAGARSCPGGGPRPRRRRPGRRGPGPAAVGQLAVQPDRAARRPRAVGGVGAGRTASRCSATSATPSSPGTVRRAACSSPAPTGWSPSTRCPSGRTWPGCGPASTPGDADLVDLPARRPPARRAHGARARSRPARWWPSTTTATSRPSGRATASGWRSWPAC